MDFLSSQQVSAELLESVNFDLFIAVSGLEKRCTYLAENKNIIAHKKMVLAPAGKSKDSVRKKNARYFDETGFEIFEIPSEEDHKLKLFLREFLTTSANKFLKILVDYSCMTKTWYSALIDLMQEVETDVKEIKLYFSYSPVKYEEQTKARSVKKIESGLSFSAISSSKPTALIIGLGIEKSKAELVIKYLQPDLTVLMYSDPAVDDRYTNAIFNNNQDLIHKTDARNIINYPLTDANAINEIITKKCVELRLFYNIVIAPLGPKIFALNAYLLSSRYPDIFVWNTGSHLPDKTGKNLPSGELVIQMVTFVNEDEDY